MEGVCVMLDEKPDWPTAKKVLGDSNFLNNLKGYDKDNIPEPTIKKLQKSAAASRDAIFMNAPPSHFHESGLWSFNEPVRTASGLVAARRRERARFHEDGVLMRPRRRDAVVMATRESYAVAATRQSRDS
jgi:hypothetical protein